MTPTLEFPFEAPCAGRLDGLLALAVDRAEGDRPAAARARAHASTCPRCRRALHWLATSQRVLRDLPWGPRRPSIVPLATRKFEQWLDRALSKHSAKVLADAGWRIARAIAFSVPAFAEVTARAPGEDLSVDRLLADFEVELLSPTLHERSSRPRNLALSPALRRRLRKLQDGSPMEDVIRIAGDLAMFVDRQVTEKPGKATLLRAVIEWMYGDDRKVEPLLDAVAARSDTAPCRAEALATMATWESDHGRIGSALRLNSTALAMAPENRLALRNRVCLESMLGRASAADGFLSRLLRTRSGRSFVAAMSLRRIVLIARSLADVLDLAPPVALERERRLIERMGAAFSNAPALFGPEPESTPCQS